MSWFLPNTSISAMKRLQLNQVLTSRTMHDWFTFSMLNTATTRGREDRA
jgi:hypothetical protein